MDYKVTITGLSGLKKTPDEIRKGLDEGFKLARLFTEGESKKNFKGHAMNELYVRSGHLRRSIYSEGEILGFIVGSPVVYASIHQFGGKARRNRSVTIPARPFIKPDAEKIADFLVRGLDKEIKNTK